MERAIACTAVVLCVAACASLTGPEEPRPPRCAEGEETRDAVGVVRTRVEPKYPRAAARMGKSGFVCMNFTVRRDGTVGDICVSNEEPKRIFDRAAVEALQQWRFAPAAEPFPSGVCLQFYTAR